MRRAVRVGLVVLGAAIAVYGAASLTGGWLGTPPWWGERWEVTEYNWIDRYGTFEGTPFSTSTYRPAMRAVPVPGGDRIAAGIVAVGLAIAAVGAWPRQHVLRRSLLAVVVAVALYGVASVGALLSSASRPRWGIFGFKPFPWRCRPWSWVDPDFGAPLFRSTPD